MKKSKFNKLKIVLALGLAATMMIPSAIKTVEASVNNPVPVYLDGVLLTFEEAQPQIMNDRTMVPLTETAAHFGMTFTWNPTTSEMVFTNDYITMRHTTFSDAIEVNGTTIVYDTPPYVFTSTIVDGRTLMPIRMLADALGAEVEWDAPNRRVLITTTNNIEPHPMPTVPPINTSTRPSILEIDIPNRSIEQDEGVVINVQASLGTTRVRITTSNGRTVLAESSEFTETSQARIFEVRFEATTLGENTVRISVGTDTGFDMTTRTATFTVIESQRTRIINVNPANPRGRVNVPITIIVRTSADVTRLEILNQSGSVIRSATVPMANAPQHRQWEIENITIGSPGTHTLTVRAVGANNVAATQEIQVTIEGRPRESINTLAEFANNDGLGAQTLSIFERFITTITTNQYTEYIYVEDGLGNEIGTFRDFTDTGNGRRWDLSWNLHSYTGISTINFRIFAVDEFGDAVTRSVTVTIAD
ncbi:MAG: copper amine oxidase N-terminal domain-containing protein [Defluviitaleaceae bacterium]|nr:copper amine oxidase N-terminal domain-containing protein [Defluviitaleaceae bacterium]